MKWEHESNHGESQIKNIGYVYDRVFESFFFLFLLPTFFGGSILRVEIN